MRACFLYVGGAISAKSARPMVFLSIFARRIYVPSVNDRLHDHLLCGHESYEEMTDQGKRFTALWMNIMNYFTIDSVKYMRL